MKKRMTKVAAIAMAAALAPGVPAADRAPVRRRAEAATAGKRPRA